MHDAGFGLPYAMHAQQRRADNHLALTLENIVPENDIDRPGFVFDRHEHRALGSLWPLPMCDDAARAREPSARDGLQLGRSSHFHFRQPRPQQSQRMTAERQAEPLIIGDDVGAFGWWRKLDSWLRETCRLQRLRASRLDTERFPAGLMPMAGKRGERSTCGQRFELE